VEKCRRLPANRGHGYTCDQLVNTLRQLAYQWSHLYQPLISIWAVLAPLVSPRDDQLLQYCNHDNAVIDDCLCTSVSVCTGVFVTTSGNRNISAIFGKKISYFPKARKLDCGVYVCRTKSSSRRPDYYQCKLCTCHTYGWFWLITKAHTQSHELKLIIYVNYLICILYS